MHRLALLLILSALLLSGCRSNAGGELLEAELRARNDDLRQARFDLERSQAYSEYLQRELRNLRLNSSSKPPRIGASTSTAVQKIELGRQTGGYEQDGLPGDEMLQVVLEPRDLDGHTVKAAGTVEILALTISKEGLKQPLCSWVVPRADLGKMWRSGLLSTGYFIRLKWKNWPTTRKVRVVVRFLSADERLFEKDKDITVRVLPSMIRKITPSVPPVKVEQAPPPVEKEAPPELVPVPPTPVIPAPPPLPVDEWIPPPI